MATHQQLKDAFLADWNDTSAYEFGGQERSVLTDKEVNAYVEYRAKRLGLEA